MKIVSDHGFPKGDGSYPDDDPFDRFKNERDYISQTGNMKTTVAAMDWAAAEIDRLRKFAQYIINEGDHVSRGVMCNKAREALSLSRPYCPTPEK